MSNIVNSLQKTYLEKMDLADSHYFFCGSGSCSLSEFVAAIKGQPCCEFESYIWSGTYEDS